MHSYRQTLIIISFCSILYRMDRSDSCSRILEAFCPCPIDALVNVHRNFMNKHVPNFHSFNNDTSIVLSLIKSMEVCLIVQFQHGFYLNIFKTLYMNAMVNFSLSFLTRVFIIYVLLKKEGNITCECKIY